MTEPVSATPDAFGIRVAGSPGGPEAPVERSEVDLIENDEAISERPMLPIVARFDSLPEWTPPKRERRVRLLVLACLCAIFIPNLGAFGLWDCWETHYGTVTNEMLETYDWISPWWGWKGKIGDDAANEAGGFYSKPIFIFWAEASAARMIGRGEWAIRLPCALLALMAAYLAYIAVSKIWSRKTGLLAAGILATSPFYFMVSRQAQTDMPLVATMLIAMCFLLLALFGPREHIADRKFLRRTWLTIGLVLASALPQYGLLLTDFPFPSPSSVSNFGTRTLIDEGWFWALVYLVPLMFIGWRFTRQWRREYRVAKTANGIDAAFKDRWNRKYLLVAFYVFVSYAHYAKGLLGFMLPGAIILIWLILSRNWVVLRSVEIARGVGLFLCIGTPWYVAMIVKHGKPYWMRFFWHDQFNRVGAGVHQIDSGTFEHFIKWLGIGFFPWVAFVPFALFWLVRLRARDNRAGNQALLLVAVWALVSFTLFTSSSTKFHHYIFPAVPAMAIVTALYIRHLVQNGQWLARFAALLGIVCVLAVGLDINGEPQHLRNLMTYKYDRPLPTHLPIDADAPVADGSSITWKDGYFWKNTSPVLQATLTAPILRYDRFVPIIIGASILALCLFFVTRTRIAGLVALGLTASTLGVWALNYYMPSLSPHWSQKYLFDGYYATCKMRPMSEEIEAGFDPILAQVGLRFLTDELRSEPKRICDEDIISWLITWRGETYYSYNELKPLAKREQLPTYLEQYNGGMKFYAITERGKASSLRGELKTATETLKKKKVRGFEDITDWTVDVVVDENLYFQTLVATPTRG